MKVGLWAEDLDLFDYKNGRDEYTHRWYALFKNFEKNSIELSVFNDINKAIEFDIVIENGIQGCEHENKYLLIIESNAIRPQDWNINEHDKYKKIFCWDDNLVDNKKFFKINYSFDIPKIIPKKFYEKKLCCTIAGNKTANHPDELYSKRVKFIKWFEKQHLEDFDLYGTQWAEYRFGRSFFGKVLNKIEFLKKSTFPSYKGRVESKFETMKNYKFSICYENIKDQYGYITEKIFDSFFAGCVPIYWGAKNVTEYIPKECFIDKRAFDSFEGIYKFIKGMDEETYIKYLDAIEIFLNSSKADSFRSEVFADTIVSEILKDIKE